MAQTTYATSYIWAVRSFRERRRLRNMNRPLLCIELSAPSQLKTNRRCLQTTNEFTDLEDVVLFEEPLGPVEPVDLHDDLLLLGGLEVVLPELVLEVLDLVLDVLLVQVGEPGPDLLRLVPLGVDL